MIDDNREIESDEENNNNKISQEGPHSALCDEEFYDAVETGLDKIDEENQIRDRLKQKVVSIPTSPTTPVAKHRLWPEVMMSELFSVEQTLNHSPILFRSTKYLWSNFTTLD